MPATTLLYLLFLITGFGSLANEILYLKYVEASIGSPLTSVSVVLMAFFAGTLGGNFLASRFLTRASDRVLKICLVVGEISLLAFALALVPVVDLGRETLLRFYAVDQSPALRSLLISVVGLFMLALPCLALGFRGPVLAAWLGRNKEASMDWAWGLSLLGCCAGVAVVSFFLIETTTLSRSALFLNGPLAALGIFSVLALRLPGRGVATVAGPTPEVFRGRARAFLFFFTTGVLVIACETVWTRYLLGFVPHVRFVFSAIAVAIMLGMGLGSFLARRVAATVPSLVITGSLFAATFTLLMALQQSFPVLHKGLATSTLGVYAVGIIWRTALITALPSVFLGMLFPLGYRYFSPKNGDLGDYAPLAYGANTVGGMVGAFLGGFLLLEWLGTRGALLSLSASTAAVVLGVLIYRRRLLPLGLHLGALGALATGALVAPILFKEEGVRTGYSVVTRVSASDADTEVLEGMEDDQVVKLLVQNKAILAGSSSFHTVRKQKSEALLPGLFSGGRSRALVIGFGTGTTASAVADLGYQQIDCVEISKSAARLAGYFEDVNGGILKKPIFKLTIDDGTLFVKKTKEVYDLVLADVVSFQAPGTASLYTHETFSQYARVLSPKGVLVQWLPLKQIPPDRFEVIVKTFSAVFPHGWLFYGDPDALPLQVGLVAMGSPGPLVFNDLTARYVEKRNLWETWHLNPGVAVAHFIAPVSVLKERTAKLPLASVDNPVLERYFVGGDFTQTNEALLTQIYQSGWEGAFTGIDLKSRLAMEQRRRLFSKTRDLFAMRKSENQGTALTRLAALLEREGVAPDRLSEIFPALSHLQGELLFSQALSQYRTNQSASGETLMAAAMKTVYRNSRFYRQNGGRGGSTGDLEVGEKYLSETLRLEPSNTQTLLNLARIHLLQTRRDEAVARVDGAVLAGKGDSAVLGQAMLLYIQADRSDRVKSLVPRYLRLKRPEKVIMERVLKYVVAKKDGATANLIRARLEMTKPEVPTGLENPDS